MGEVLYTFFIFVYFLNHGVPFAIADTNNSSFTKLPILMPLACRGFVFWIKEGDREKKKKEKKGISLF